MRLIHCRNFLLLQFGDDLRLIEKHMRHVILHAGQVLNEPGDPVQRIYFPHGGLVSRLFVFEDGSEIDCMPTGRDGAVGAVSTRGFSHSLTRDVCQHEAPASVVDPLVMLEAYRTSDAIRGAFDRYFTWVARYAIRSAACNARHNVEQRLARCLLQTADLLEQVEVHLSQDVFAKLLGAQRSSVNPILQRFRAEGLVELGRSRVRLLDRPRLTTHACECYRSMVPERASLIEAPAGRPRSDQIVSLPPAARKGAS